MTTTVVIESPKPNHNLLVVVAQSLDDEGAPVGEPREVAVLDDGQRYVGHVWANQVLTTVERPRNVSSQPDQTTTTVPVIGGEVQVGGDGDGGGEGGGEGGGDGGSGT